MKSVSTTLGILLRDLTPVHTTGDLNIEISGLAFDSRKVKPGHIFVAIQGFELDGNVFQTRAIQAGAVAIVSENPPASALVTFIQVEDARVALAQLAAVFYGHPDHKLHLVGLTGTNGKTTTAYLIKSIFEAAGKSTGLLGTIDYLVGDEVIPSQLTTPESPDLFRYLVEMIDSGQSHAVLEVSSHGIVMQRTHGVHFDNVVFTNLTHDHLDFHKSKAAYLAAKSRIFENLTSDDVAIVNCDDPASETISHLTVARLLRYSLKDRCADFFAKEMNWEEGCRTVEINWNNKQFEFRTTLNGIHNLYNITAAVAVGLINDVDAHFINRGIQMLPQIRGRLEPVEAGQPFHVFVDYAHNPDALKQTIVACREVSSGKVIVVFGCGGGRDPGKRPIMGKIAETYADLVFLTSDNPRDEDAEMILDQIETGIVETSKTTRILDRRTAIQEALQSADAGDVVLIAGKGHETYQIVKGKTRQFDDSIIAKECLREL